MSSISSAAAAERSDFWRVRGGRGGAAAMVELGVGWMVGRVVGGCDVYCGSGGCDCSDGIGIDVRDASRQCGVEMWKMED